tara:strand:- start:300 stop:488 length:189 start_codon:yes stop_codon:yes gene_type:complete
MNKLYNYSYNITVSYWADIFDDGQINTNEFLVVPIALNDEVKEELNKNIKTLVQKHMDKEKY